LNTEEKKTETQELPGEEEPPHHYITMTDNTQAQPQVGQESEDIQPLKGGESDVEIAKKLSAIVDSANERIKPLLDTMNEHFVRAEADKANDNLDEQALVNSVRPLLEQSTNILRETNGAIKALDPSGTISNNASRKASDHDAGKEEQHLAESLATLTGDVTKTVEGARSKIQNMPKAKKDLGPLLDMIQEPLFQIVSGVGLLLNGVLQLLGNLLDGLGLGGIVRNILSGLGLEKVLKGLGLDGLFKGK